MKAKLIYSDTAFATIETSANEALSNEALVKGTKGEMIVRAIVYQVNLTF